MKRRNPFSTFITTGLAAALFAVAGPASATAGETGAYSVILLANHSSRYTVKDWFALNTTTTYGSCGTVGGSRTPFKILDDDRGKKMFALIEAAYLSGKLVKVAWDDADKVDGYCVARYITLQ
jgi:hypothetical protein